MHAVLLRLFTLSCTKCFFLTSSMFRLLCRLSLFVSVCFLLETECTASRRREGKSQIRTDETEKEKEKNKGKKEKKRGKRDWALPLRCFSLLLFLSCKPSVCVISIYKLLHRLTICSPSPTDCTSAH